MLISSLSVLGYPCCAFHFGAMPRVRSSRLGEPYCTVQILSGLPAGADRAGVWTEERTWHNQGFDACRANSTGFSPNMEWCLKRPEQVEVLAVEWSDTLKGEIVGVANP